MVPCIVRMLMEGVHRYSFHVSLKIIVLSIADVVRYPMHGAFRWSCRSMASAHDWQNIHRHLRWTKLMFGSPFFSFVPRTVLATL